MLRNYNKFTSYNLDDLSQAYWQLKVTAKWVTFTKMADCSILFVVHVGIVACQNCHMQAQSVQILSMQNIESDLIMKARFD